MQNAGTIPWRQYINVLHWRQYTEDSLTAGFADLIVSVGRKHLLANKREKVFLGLHEWHGIYLYARWLGVTSSRAALQCSMLARDPSNSMQLSFGQQGALLRGGKGHCSRTKLTVVWCLVTQYWALGFL